MCVSSILTACAAIWVCLNLVLSVHVGKHAEQQEFYDALYSVTDDPEVVLHHLVQHKEAFAEHACRIALREALGP